MVLGVQISAKHGLKGQFHHPPTWQEIAFSLPDSQGPWVHRLPLFAELDAHRDRHIVRPLLLLLRLPGSRLNSILVTGIRLFFNALRLFKARYADDRAQKGGRTGPKRLPDTCQKP